MATCPSLLLLRAAAATLPPSLAKKRSVQGRSAKSITAEFSQRFWSTRKYQNCRSNLPTGSKIRRFPCPRSVSSSSSSSPASASAAMAEDAILEALKLDEGAKENASMVVEESSKADEETIKKKSGDEDGQSSSSGSRGTTLHELRWNQTFVEELPGDSVVGGPVRQVLHSCYSKVAPSATVKDPQLVSWSEPVAKLLDIDPKE